MARGIANRQAVALLERAIGRTVPLSRLSKFINRLHQDRRMSEHWEQTAELLPEDVDRLSGELWKLGAPWYQKRNVQGDFDAWVLVGGTDWRLLHLPFARKWDPVERAESGWVPDRIAVWTWPTALVVGYLVRRADREGLPAYVEASVEDAEGSVEIQPAAVRKPKARTRAPKRRPKSGP